MILGDIYIIEYAWKCISKLNKDNNKLFLWTKNEGIICSLKPFKLENIPSFIFLNKNTYTQHKNFKLKQRSLCLTIIGCKNFTQQQTNLNINKILNIIMYEKVLRAFFSSKV